MEKIGDIIFHSRFVNTLESYYNQQREQFYKSFFLTNMGSWVMRLRIRNYRLQLYFLLSICTCNINLIIIKLGKWFRTFLVGIYSNLHHSSFKWIFKQKMWNRRFLFIPFRILWVKYWRRAYIEWIIYREVCKTVCIQFSWTKSSNQKIRSN